MKGMPKKELVELIECLKGDDIVSKATIERLFDIYGDDYFADSSRSPFELCKENKARKDLLQQRKRWY